MSSPAKHTHINIKNCSYIKDVNNIPFRWIECFCGLTGIEQNKKLLWNKSNIKNGVMIFK
ncbi:MAG: hypothetical protein GTO02_07845 [Candidatus Dadabacteria bacterium]|nr:hypothetical protein [Candidatus Dadabacteria bacterium]